MITIVNEMLIEVGSNEFIREVKDEDCNDSDENLLTGLKIIS